jgi:hypothetical protein
MRTPYLPNLTKRRYTPLLIELDELVITNIEDPPLPEDPLDIDEPIYLSPRFYIKIYKPATHNTTGSLSTEGQIIHIQRSGILSGKLQLLLRPSIGYGINSCYRIEYWQWEKILLPKGYSLSGVPGKNRLAKDKAQNKHKLIRQEYWYIPNSDGSLNFDYNSQVSGYPYGNLLLNRRVNTNPIIKVEMERYDSNPQDIDMDYLYPPQQLEAFDICSIMDEEGIEWTDYSITPITLTLNITRENITRAIGIQWGLTQPRPASKYTLTYIKPFTLCDVVFLENNRSDNLYNNRRLNNVGPYFL